MVNARLQAESVKKIRDVIERRFLGYCERKSRGEAVTLAAGTRLSPYDVTAQIGVGGMGAQRD